LDLPNIKHIIAVGSGKGGVGKSTIALNLAVSLAKTGLQVGLMDADIYGPSVPRLVGLKDQSPPPVQKGDKMPPFLAHGIKIMSMGFLVKENTATVWRAPMIQSAVLQMLRDVDWGNLDVLIIDLPPGTGDIQLTLSQKIRLSGAVIVSTPQDIALIDARKAIHMFQKLHVPILGIIENMSYFLCPKCGTQSDIFGHGGARADAVALSVPFLGEIPLHATIRSQSDAGLPVSTSQNQHATIFAEIAQSTLQSLKQEQKPFPKIVFA
jgi:ATP-binding protein involved in chromosome partitioning